MWISIPIHPQGKASRNAITAYTDDLVKDCPTEPVEQLTNSDNEVVDAEPDGQLANSANKAPDSEDKNVKEEMEVTTKKAKNDRNRKELASFISMAWGQAYNGLGWQLIPTWIV